jgi:hypothetical protein
MQVLGDFQDTHPALLVLSVCMGVFRVTFLLRAGPQTLVKGAADVLDDLSQEIFATIYRTVLPDRVWSTAQLLILFILHYRTGNSPADSQGIGHLCSKLSFTHRAEL